MSLYCIFSIQKNPSLGLPLVKIPPEVSEATLWPRAQPRVKDEPLLTWETTLDRSNWTRMPEGSPPPSHSKLARQDAALILDPPQKISLGKPSHDSWAPWWQLSVDNAEKNLNAKSSGEELMRETRCALRIQLERVVTLPGRFNFF